MPASNTDALRAVLDKEYAKLCTLIAAIPEEEALIKDADGISVKDIIGHRAHWVDLFLGWYADGLAGKEVHFPAKGYKWNDLRTYDAALRIAQKDLGWEEAKALLDDAHRRLSEFVRERDDRALYAGPMKGAKNAWTPGRWAEAAGPRHYRSAAKYIRARRKNPR